MIRKLDIEDLQDVLVICHKFFYEGYYREVGAGSVDDCINYVTDWLVGSHKTCLGYYQGNVLVGFVCVSITTTYWNRPVGHIDELLVMPECRRGVVAKSLIEEAIELCHNANCIEVYAASNGLHRKNHDKIFTRFMKQYGFKPCSTILRKG